MDISQMGIGKKTLYLQVNSLLKMLLYHSKSLMIRLGNKESLPLEFEFGMLTAAQFGGKRMIKNSDGSVSLIKDMPDSFKDFWKIFIPKRGDGLENVQGNHCEAGILLLIII